MPIKKEREYRALAAPLTAQSATKLIQTEYYVEGYATTFDTPYLLYEFEDGTKIYERIDAHALDGADMSDVIMQYDHEGRVFARQSNKTLILQPDYKGLKVAADLGKTDLARGLYQDIEAGMIIAGYGAAAYLQPLAALIAGGNWNNGANCGARAVNCNLDKVREDILNLAYEPSEYHYFKVYEPKERQIMALPFYDRVVQHAINNVLEPIFDKRFISQSYACRKGKGMHAASDTLKEWLYEWNKYHPDQPLYAIKADIHHYFQSIDHAVLKTEIRKVIKDAGVLALLDRIIDHNGNMPDGVGIPVGNLTSQLFANIYLDALDQFIKHELGVEAYIRYMDDFVILSPDKEQLRSWLARIEQFLREELKLEFNPKTTILAAKNGIDFVGYKHRATHRKVRKDSIKRIKRTIKKCESGKITKEQLQKSIQSWTGHAGHADSYNLRKKIETLAEAAIEKAA